MRSLFLALIALVVAGCDPIYSVSASGQVLAPLDQTCIVETLRNEKTVKSADVYDASTISAQVIIPEGLKKNARDKSDPYAVVEHRRNDREGQEIIFEMNFVPTRESPDYEAYVQKVLNQLRDRTIEKCSAK